MRFTAVRLIGACVLAAVSAAGVGCQSYDAKPLTRQAVNKALTPPGTEKLNAEASALSHPTLKPVTLNLTSGLTPQSAGVLAVLVNPGLKALRDRASVSGAQLLQAGLLPNPQLALSADIPTDGNTQGTVVAAGYGLSWDFRSLLDRAAKVAAASKAKQQVNLQIAWREWEVALQAKTAVYNVVAVSRQLHLARQTDQRLAQNLEVIKTAVGAGQMTAMDLAAARTASQQAQAKVIDLQNQVTQARLSLNALLGLPASRKVRLARGIALADVVPVPKAQTLVSGLGRRRLDLIAMRKGYASQEAKVRVAILDQFPRINLGLNHQTDTSNVGTVGVGLSIELPVFDRNQAQIAEARATRKLLFDEYVDRVFKARNRIASLVAEIGSLNAQVKAAKKAVPGLRSLVQTYRRAVNQGQADVLSYYTAWGNLTDKRIEVLHLEEQLAARRIALELAAGMYELPSGPAKTEPATQPDRK